MEFHFRLVDLGFIRNAEPEEVLAHGGFTPVQNPIGKSLPRDEFHRHAAVKVFVFHVRSSSAAAAGQNRRIG